MSRKIQHGCKGTSPKKILYKTIPALEWLSHYRWKDWLSSDLVAGFTVAVMHMPQGMAYALLGNVPPITGIYMAFFPVLMYFLLGTSKHNSLGNDFLFLTNSPQFTKIFLQELSLSYV